MVRDAHGRAAFSHRLIAATLRADVGTRSDASIVTQTFNLDGNFGLETFAFTGFTDLVSVTWDQVVDYHQFDNVVLTPEPSTLALLAAGVLGLTVGAFFLGVLPYPFGILILLVFIVARVLSGR